MSDDLNFLANYLHPADKTYYKKWRQLLDSPSRTRVQQRVKDQHTRLLTLQLICISEKLMQRLEPPFNFQPNEKNLEPLNQQSFDKYRTLLLRIQLSQQQKKQGQDNFRQIIAKYNDIKQQRLQRKPSSLRRQSNRPRTQQAVKDSPANMVLTGEVPQHNLQLTAEIERNNSSANNKFEFDPTVCYTSQQFRNQERNVMKSFKYSDLSKLDIENTEPEEPERAELFQEDYDEIAVAAGEPSSTHVDEMEYTYFSSTVKRLRGGG